MQLRKFLQRPNRYEEEYERGTSQVMSARSNNNTPKCTIPAHPALLRSQVKLDNRQLRPAAFPSLSLKRRQGKAEQPSLNNTESQVTNHLRSRYREPSHDRAISINQDERAGQDDAGVEVQEDVDTGSGNLAQQDLVRLSPVRPSSSMPAGTIIPKVYWNNIDPGLQLYIYDSLQLQFILPEFIGEVLGLDLFELKRLINLKNQRSLHPRSTEELWDYCRSVGGTTNSFVDPDILREHLDYFAFTSQFESSSTTQRHTAVLFLRQRGIEGAFVEALLPDRSGLWIRPEYKKPDRLHEIVPSGTSAFDDEVEWEGLLSRTPAHESHDLAMVADYFKSRYFPANIRRSLLAKPLGHLDTFQKWLMYGEVYPTTENYEAAMVDFAHDRAMWMTAFKGSIVKKLSSIFEDHGEQYRDIEDLNDQSDQIYDTLYHTKRDTVQSRLVQQKIHGMRVNRQQKQTALGIVNRRGGTEGHGNSSSLLPKITRDIQDFAPSSAISTSSETDRRQSSSHSPESIRRGPATLNATNDLSREDVSASEESESNSSSQTARASRNRALPEQSYHTAPDHTHDIHNDTKFQHLLDRSPSPPPWSPMSDDEDTDMLNLDASSANAVSLEAVEQTQVVSKRFVGIQKYTPWKSHGTISKNMWVVSEAVQKVGAVETPKSASEGSLLKSSDHNENSLEVLPSTRPNPSSSLPAAQATSQDDEGRNAARKEIQNHPKTSEHPNVEVPRPHSDLLSGLDHPATTLISPPSVSSNLDPLSLEASSPPTNRQMPRLSPPKQDTKSSTEPPKTMKGKKKGSVQSERQAQPRKKAKKPALTIQIPKLSAPISTSTSPSTSASSASSPRRGPYKTRSDNGKKRGPYTKKMGTASPEKKSNDSLKEGSSKISK